MLFAMMKWFTVLVLIGALGSSVSAGTLMHSGMEKHGMMDCCKAALGSDDAMVRSAASLCCAINCPEPTPTSSSVRNGTSQLPVAALHPAAAYPGAVLFHAPLRFTETQPLTSSQPSYIRNLALLI